MGSITGEDEGGAISLVSITRQPFLSIGAIKNAAILGLMRSTGGVGGDPGFVAIAESAFLITRQPTLLVGLSVSEQVEAPVSPKDDDDASLAVAPEVSQLNASLIVSFIVGVAEG